MDKTEAIEANELGRPRKCARRELPRIDENEYGEESGESNPVQDFKDDNLDLLARAPEVLDNGGLAAMETAPEAGVSALTIENYGLPSSSRRRRPRKSIPRRSPQV